ncbi:MAG: GIY-YIG nuclease family protein [bacterium]
MQQFSYQWLVYIVECSDASYYCGLTTDLAARLTQHNSGRGSLYTSARAPVKLVWAREFDNEMEARAFERRVKNWGRLKKGKLIRGEVYTN